MVISRRLVLALAALAGGGIPSSLLRPAGAAEIAALPLWAALDHLPAFVALGRRVVTELPELGQRQPGELQRLIAGRLGLSLSSEAPAVIGALRDAIREDSRQGRMSLVDGWALASTEILVSALAYRAFG